MSQRHFNVYNKHGYGENFTNTVHTINITCSKQCENIQDNTVQFCGCQRNNLDYRNHAENKCV